MTSPKYPLPEDTSDYKEGFVQGRESVWKELFENASYDYSWSRDNYSMTVRYWIGYDDINLNEKGRELALKYSDKFRIMYAKIQEEEAQREKENYG